MIAMPKLRKPRPDPDLPGNVIVSETRVGGDGFFKDWTIRSSVPAKGRRPRARTKSPAQLQREIDQALARRTEEVARLPDAGAKETKKNLAVMKAFNAKVEKLLDQASAKLHHELSPDHRQFVLETKAGPLFVTPLGNWVATRFEDPAAAAKLVGTSALNTYSGKWNHNYFDWPVSEALRDVARWLKKIVEVVV